MKQKTLREIAKFVAGLVAADFIAVWWLASTGSFPIEFFGILFTEMVVLPAMVFDGALFLALIHYGWHIGTIPHPRERSYLLLAGIVFGLVALAHLFRLFTGASVAVAGWNVPLWLSWVGTAGATYLSYASLHFAFSKR